VLHIHILNLHVTVWQSGGHLKINILYPQGDQRSLTKPPGIHQENNRVEQGCGLKYINNNHFIKIQKITYNT